MRFSDRLRVWLRRERDDAAQLLADTEQRIDADLTRRERDLAASPEERLAALQDEIAGTDADLEALRERLRQRPPPTDAGPGPG
jgi:hypothetical protein